MNEMGNDLFMDERMRVKMYECILPVTLPNVQGDS